MGSNWYGETNRKFPCAKIYFFYIYILIIYIVLFSTISCLFAYTAIKFRAKFAAAKTFLIFYFATEFLLQ